MALFLPSSVYELPLTLLRTRGGEPTYVAPSPPIHTMHFAKRSKVGDKGIGLNARDAIALRMLCMGEVDDGLSVE